MNWAEERSTLSGVFVSLCEVPSPISDDASTIRCRCSRGCRRRCTLGRRLPCSSCGSMVGSCCGSRSASAASPRNNGPSHVIVCHVCLGDRLEYQCQWDVRLSDFPVMTADAWFRWQRTSRRAEEQRAELIWRDLEAEVLSGLASQSTLSRSSALSLPSSSS